MSGVYGWRVTCLFTGAAAQWGSTQRDVTHRIFLWVYTRVQHNRIQHRVFVWVYTNIHITEHKCLRSVASHRRSPQDPAEVHLLTLYTWYVQHSQEFHTRVQCMCNSKVNIPKSWLHWPAVLYPAPCHPPFAPSFGGAQGLGTTPESTCPLNGRNAARVSQHYRPIARIAECDTSRPHSLCPRRFHLLQRIFE